MAEQRNSRGRKEKSKEFLTFGSQLDILRIGAIGGNESIPPFLVPTVANEGDKNQFNPRFVVGKKDFGVDPEHHYR